MGNKKLKAYDAENLKHLGVCVNRARPEIEGDKETPNIKVNLIGLEKAVKALPKKDRETIERFWGLNGGPNHSKKIGLTQKNDVAYQNMFKEAIQSFRKLFWVDYVNMYDENFNELVQIILKKVNKDNATKISDIEVIKYLIGFFILIWNGPKMSFEENLLEIDNDYENEATCDEYAIMKYMYVILKAYPDKSVNLKLLIEFFEMLDFQDKLVAKKSVGLEIEYDCRVSCESKAILETKKKMNIASVNAQGINPNQVETARVCTDIRRFKERAFKFGPWARTCELIIGNIIPIEEFMQIIAEIYKKWSWTDEFEKFSTGKKVAIRTSSEVRNLDIYNIGGLEFTDLEEVDFLYSNRNFIMLNA